MAKDTPLGGYLSCLEDRLEDDFAGAVCNRPQALMPVFFDRSELWGGRGGCPRMCPKKIDRRTKVFKNYIKYF